MSALLALQVQPQRLNVEESDASQLLSAAAAARRIAILSIGCVRNLLAGGGGGTLTEAARNDLAATLTRRVYATPLPGLLGLGCGLLAVWH